VRLKPGVRILGVKPEILLAIMVADGVFKDHGLELVITSITEGTHMRGSEHYTGNAFDFRIRDITEPKVRQICHSIGGSLGADYDVVLETDHGHVEYDPKTPY